MSDLYEYMHSLCKESKKVEKVMMRKAATSRKSESHNREWKTRHISVCGCL